MVQITKYPGFRHLRSEPSRHVLHWSRGRLERSGRGLAYWFRPLSASVAEVPCDDRELSFLFHGRSADFQDVTVQGVLTWRVVDPELVASRVDFSVDLASGRWLEEPLERLGEVLSNRAQQHAWDAIAAGEVRALLERGVEPVRERIRAGLGTAPEIAGLGIEIVGVSVSKISPTSELERALQVPANERIQQQADEATFRRRALAVEKERAIEENELQNRIELATREADLIAQRGGNQQRAAREEAEAQRIAVEAESERARIHASAEAETSRLLATTEVETTQLRATTEVETSRLRAAADADAARLDSAARADGIRAVEDARVSAERERMEIYAGLDQQVQLGLAAREFAGKLDRIEHLNVGPDMLGLLLSELFQSGARLLEAKADDAAGEA